MIAATILAAMLSSPPQAAYTARVYLPGKAKSGYAVYLWRGPGTASVRLTMANGSADNLNWTGRNTLEWDERTGEVTKRTRLDLTSMAKSKAAPKESSDDPLVPLTGMSYEGLVIDGWEWDTDATEARTRLGATWVMKLVDGRRFAVHADDQGSKYPRQLLRVRGVNEFILLSAESEFRDLWLVNSINGRGKLISRDLAYYEFHPESPYWCGRTEFKETIEFDGMMLWHQLGYVGNWKTGERWEVLDSPAYLTSISLRPEK